MKEQIVKALDRSQCFFDALLDFGLD